MQLAGRFGLSSSRDTDPLPVRATRLCFPLRRRLWEEVEKMGHPIHSSFHGTLLSKGRVVISLNQMIGIPQDPHWHPEGDVWEHFIGCDAMVGAESWQDGLSCEDRLAIMMACLLQAQEKSRRQGRSSKGPPAHRLPWSCSSKFAPLRVFSIKLVHLCG